MNKVLVTGATGTVGSQVVQDLLKRNIEVRAFARDRARATATLGRDAEVDVAIGDLANPVDVRMALKGVDAVFLACGNDPLQVELETNVIDAAIESESRIVKLSNLGAEVGSRVAFWDQHARIERHLRETTLRSVVLQPSFFMSNLLASAVTIQEAGQFYLPGGGARVAMIDPFDVATAASNALTDETHDGRTYRLTGPTALTFHAIADELSTVSGRTVHYVDVPDGAAQAAMAEAGVPVWIVDNIVAVFGNLREGAHSTVTDDFRQLTGRQPRGFGEFARDHAAIFEL